MIELCWLELASITTTINENKVGRYKDTVEELVTCHTDSEIQCLPVSNIQNVYFTRQRNQAQTASKKTWCLKGLAPADLVKKRFTALIFVCFLCDYYVALISALVQLKCGNLRITAVV